MDNHHHDLRGIIIAGGSGNRLRSFTRRLYGEERPKQYCAFIGTRTMLQHTVDRTRMLIRDKDLYMVVSQAHLPYAQQQVSLTPSDHMIVQPYCRETAASVLLPLSRILHRNENAVTAIFPADHFILDEWKFLQYVQQAAAFVRRHPERIVLLGVRPDRVDHGYGWIVPGDRLTDRIRSVRAFIEKPLRSPLNAALYESVYWNTFVMVARAGTLAAKIRETAPALVDAFAIYRRSIGTLMEQQAISAAYEHAPTLNLSSAILQHIAPSLAVMDVSDIGWSDWGEESRIRDDVARYDLRFRIPPPSDEENHSQEHLHHTAAD